MTRGRYPSDRNRDLTNLAAAVVGATAASALGDPRWTSRPFSEADHSYHVHARKADCRCACDSSGMTARFCPEHGERAYRYTAAERVIDAAREYWRTDGDTHNELMDAVAALEQAERHARHTEESA